MEVILKEDVPKLGSRGDVVKVAEGYGRNFLLPKKLAIEATQANKAVIEQMKAASVRRLQKDKAAAEALAAQLAGVTITFHRRSGEHEQLFGSVTSGDLAAELEKQGLQHRSPQDPARRAAQDPGRVQGPGAPVQGRDGADQGRSAEGSGAGTVVSSLSFRVVRLPVRGKPAQGCGSAPFSFGLRYILSSRLAI